MLKRCYLLILIVFVLAGTGCTHRLHKQSPQPVMSSAGSTMNQTRQIPAFDQVNVQGRINLNLHTGYKQPQLILTGDPRDLAQVKTITKLNTLYVVLGGGYPRYGAVNADIRGQTLHRIDYAGAGSINGNQLYSNMLDVSLVNQGTTKLAGSISLRNLDVTGDGFTQIDGITSPDLQIHFKGNPKVQLTGVINLRKLDMEGAGWLSMYWLKSNNLTIRAKNEAKIQLAGVVNRLDVELWGNAKFKGRYLRAQRSFVKTHGQSVAEISSVNHQSNLATDASDIYYYNLPTTRADFMAFSGSVLDMREWTQYDLRDFNRYNKQFP